MNIVFYYYFVCFVIYYSKTVCLEKNVYNCVL